MKNLYLEWKDKLRNEVPMVKYIRERLKDYAVATFKYHCRDQSYRWEMQLSLIKALHAIEIYLNADKYGGGGVGFGQKEGMNVIDLRMRPQLKTPVSKETMQDIYDDIVKHLVKICGVEKKWSYGAKNALLWGINKAERLQMTAHGTSTDKKEKATYHSNEVAEKYRVLFQDGKAWMHPYWDDSQNPMSWVEADTRDKFWGATSNACYKALGEVGRGGELWANPDMSPAEKLKQERIEEWKSVLRDVIAKRRVGIGGFSMTQSRCFYVGKQNCPTYHSSYTCGGEVLCTGSIGFADGQPVLLTNQSGHYAPEAWRLEYVINLFDMVGLKTDSLNILTTDAKGNLGVYKSKKSFWERLHVKYETRKKHGRPKQVRVASQGWSPVSEEVLAT